MADSCATCFYFRGDACHANIPSTIPGANPWRPVTAADWCGEGADSSTGRSFSSTVNAVPGTGGAGPGYLATSTTSLTIAASGSKAPITQLNLAYSAGARVRLTSSGTGAWMEGVVTNYAADGTLTFTSDSASGSGTHTDWTINLAGQPGAGGVASKGSFTCGATRPIVVPDVAVAAGSKIVVMPTNAAAADAVSGASIGATGVFVSALSAGVSFSIDSSNGSSFLGTETFNYIIVN